VGGTCTRREVAYRKAGKGVLERIGAVEETIKKSGRRQRHQTLELGGGGVGSTGGT